MRFTGPLLLLLLLLNAINVYYDWSCNSATAKPVRSPPSEKALQ